jgi:putative oxidoreductase
MWAVIGATVEFVIVATGISHRFWEFAEPARRLQESQFFKNLAIIGGFLVLAVTGAGRFSLDARADRTRRAA